LDYLHVVILTNITWVFCLQFDAIIWSNIRDNIKWHDISQGCDWIWSFLVASYYRHYSWYLVVLYATIFCHFPSSGDLGALKYFVYFYDCLRIFFINSCQDISLPICILQVCVLFLIIPLNVIKSGSSILPKIYFNS
jgi:hypothetical protein